MKVSLCEYNDVEEMGTDCSSKKKKKKKKKKEFSPIIAQIPMMGKF